MRFRSTHVAGGEKQSDERPLWSVGVRFSPSFFFLQHEMLLLHVTHRPADRYNYDSYRRMMSSLTPPFFAFLRFFFFFVTLVGAVDLLGSPATSGGLDLRGASLVVSAAGRAGAVGKDGGAAGRVSSMGLPQSFL